MKSAYFCYLTDAGNRLRDACKTRRINQVYFHLDILGPAAKMRRITALWGGSKFSSRQSASEIILNQFVSITSTYFGFSLISYPYP